MHGNARDREKVMRCVKSTEIPIFEGNRIYYNFVRLHEGLDGRTPAEAARIGIKGGWEGLMKEAIDKKQTKPWNHIPISFNFVSR